MEWVTSQRKWYSRKLVYPPGSKEVRTRETIVTCTMIMMRPGHSRKFWPSTEPIQNGSQDCCALLPLLCAKCVCNLPSRHRKYQILPPHPVLADAPYITWKSYPFRAYFPPIAFSKAGKCYSWRVLRRTIIRKRMARAEGQRAKRKDRRDQSCVGVSDSQYSLDQLFPYSFLPSKQVP